MVIIGIYTVRYSASKFTRNYFFVITSLDSSFSCEDIFKLYRLRWQVEMVFKRFKSILNFGSMPTKTEASCEAWLNCKMLIAILIEKFLFSVDFSPINPTRSIWREMKFVYLLIAACFFYIPISDTKNNTTFPQISENYCVEKRKSGIRLQMYTLFLG